MLKDVAKVELAGQSYTGIGENGNNPSISMGILPDTRFQRTGDY
jgi:HAE1 family hydrophobic/amphiphilic exporter-1